MSGAGTGAYGPRRHSPLAAVAPRPAALWSRSIPMLARLVGTLSAVPLLALPAPAAAYHHAHHYHRHAAHQHWHGYHAYPHYAYGVHYAHPHYAYGYGYPYYHA